MDTSHLYMFVDYDGVVKTYAENFPDELHDRKHAFQHVHDSGTVKYCQSFRPAGPILCRSVPVRAV